MWKCLFLLVLAANLIVLNNGARILAYIPTPSFSHQVVFRPLWRELSLRGHQVTLLTTDPINDPTLTNLTEINLGFMHELADPFFAKILNLNIVHAYLKYIEMFTYSVDKELEHPSVKNLLEDTSKSFDLFIGELHVSLHFAIAEKFKCPSIGITSLIATDLILEKFGVTVHPVVYPHFMLDFKNAETLLQRLTSVFFYAATKFLDVVYMTPQQDAVITKHFGKNFPTSRELTNKVSMLFENSSPMLDKVRPRVPATVLIDGIHQISASPLPKDLKNVLDSANAGTILFSLGSNLQSKNMSETLRHTLLETFSELPYTVVWKFELEDLPNKPKNVYISKWLPQGDVLKHHNMKLFITHCGLQSIEESLAANVPILGMPFVADQPVNAKNIVDKGFGLSVDHSTLDKEQLKGAIIEVINNPKYRNTIKRATDLIKDQPMTGLERAVWWTEYVIRHQGAKHLRSPSLDIPLYQYYMLDVFSVFLMAFVTFICIILVTLRVLVQIMRYVSKKIKVQKVKEQ